MIETVPGLMEAVRARFAHVERCPFTGPRVFFENAGGALTLNTVAALSADYAAIPDNQGRDNPASAALMQVIAQARGDARLLLGATGGRVIVGESGTELIFRMIRAACLGAGGPGRVLGSTLEHPATRSAAEHWAGVAGHAHVLVAHNDAAGTVGAEAYLAELTPDTRVATIIHTSPVTGIGVDLAEVAGSIRARAPDCLIIADGIQHAAHGAIDLDAAGVDGYALSPYKAFSRHGYGLAWISERLAGLAHEHLIGGPPGNWELGTRDTGAYATFSAVVGYLDWLGARVSEAAAPRARLEAAGRAIRAHEWQLTQAMLHGTAGLPGLADHAGVQVIGGVDNPAREGLVSFWHEGLSSGEIVARLGEAGIRVHIRKADHYSGTILRPLGREDCVRVSLAHYNTEAEVARFLAAMARILPG